MKKAVLVALVMGLLVGSYGAPAEAKKKKKPKKVTRVVEGSYDAPALVIAGACAQDGAIGCVSFLATPKEKWVTVDITDSSGMAVTASVQQDTNGDGQEDVVLGEFCGKSEEPILIDPTYPVDVWVENIPSPSSGCAAVATNGQVKLTLSNLP
ncbi:MAG: hypothetical protein ABR575_09190 [Actinomycetota bacterium]